MVWLFCLENKIPIELIKIDLLTPDHGVDPVYKKFKTTSPSLQVPLLVDGDFILEERYIAIPTD
jgi:glutathione S-transferase